jgi:regulator of protease activity HflC (stomatin/prohibitin superfamily)
MVVIALVLVALTGAALSVRILKQYERAVVFRLGRVQGGARGPGLIAIVPLVDRVHRVSVRIVTTRCTPGSRPERRRAPRE